MKRSILLISLLLNFYAWSAQKSSDVNVSNLNKSFNDLKITGCNSVTVQGYMLYRYFPIAMDEYLDSVVACISFGSRRVVYYFLKELTESEVKIFIGRILTEERKKRLSDNNIKYRISFDS